MTGASSGIGKELAVVLHREGARLSGNRLLKLSIELKDQHRVVIAARRGEVLDQLKEELIVAGGENRAKVCTRHLYQDHPGQNNWSRLSPSTCLLWIV